MREVVLARYLLAKGVALLPDFTKALHAFKGQDVGPMREFLQRVLGIIFPDGGRSPAPWYHALGTAKRNALNTLQKEAHILLDELVAIKRADSPLFWESLQRRLDDLPKKVRTLELAMGAADDDRPIQRGGFTIVPMPGIKKAETDAALEALDAAAEKIRVKFPQVLYGQVYFSTHLSAKTAAQYVPSHDSIQLSVRARKRFDDIYSLIHEFGHRFDWKFQKGKPLYQEFVRLSMHKEYEQVVYDDKLREAVADEVVGFAQAVKERRPPTKLTPQAELWVKGPDLDIKPLTSAYMAGKIDEGKLHAEVKGTKDVTRITGKVVREPLSVTPYGATKPTENFAEAFAHYVLGMAMPPEFVTIFDQF
jgi:hypothetical protein